MSAQSDASGDHFNFFDSDPRSTGSILSGLLNDMESGEGHARAGHGHGKPMGGTSGIELSRLGTFGSGLGEASAEIVAHDPATHRLFVTNSNAASVDILDVADPSQPVKLASIDVSVIDGVETGGPNSVAVAGGIVAVAVEAAEATDPGKVAFFDADGGFLGAVEVGALPDMLTFTPDGARVLVANEGEPGNVDPKGSVSIIDISGGSAPRA
jgi:2',3'-cyclic-nucleotide 2'-phosphodiesterase/3'-nucleotidase/5'-nucleotidase